MDWCTVITEFMQAISDEPLEMDKLSSADNSKNDLNIQTGW